MNLTEDITLTEDQDNALTAFTGFLMNPNESVFVLKGYSGCGKSTLVKVLLNRLESILKTARLVNAEVDNYSVELTATTNKAAENLSSITGHGCGTIHSYLGLMVKKDLRSNQAFLVPRSAVKKHNVLLFIDEASYVDSQLLNFIFELTENCKIVFIGDPAQLTPVKASNTPVFDANFTGAELTQVVRQAQGNPIVDLSTKFRETVNTGEFFQFKPDGHHVKYMARNDFNEAVVEEFTRPDWRFNDSKILGWTNKCVIGFNNMVKAHVKGDPKFEVGDYAVCNSFISLGNGRMIKTDQMVQITQIGIEETRFGVDGKVFTLDNYAIAFHPNSLADKKNRIRQAKANNEYSLVNIMENEWIDLRAAYACTINKAQGSTFDKVFIDLDDVRRCNSGDQIARMLYVAVSRARNNVYLTGDLA